MKKFEVYITPNEDSEDYLNEDVLYKALLNVKDSKGIDIIDYCYVSKMVHIDD